MPASVSRTRPPGTFVILYDGHCRFCTNGARRLQSLMRRGAATLVDFQAPGALDRFPGIGYDACMKQLHLIRPDGTVHAGAEAVVQALATIPVAGRLARLYYLPGLRRIVDRLYERIAEHRYRILGRTISAGECPSGTCVLHASAARHRRSR